jgi:hypothetical protein
MEFRDRSIEGFPPGIDDDGPLRAQLIEMQSDGLADAAPDAIADDGLPQGAGSGKADMRPVGLGFADTKGREKGPCKPGTLIVNSAEVFRSQQANTFRKSSDGWLPFGADGKLFASARATAGKNGTPVLGFHPGQEPVRLGAVAVVRLKSTFRHFSSSI